MKKILLSNKIIGMILAVLVMSLMIPTVVFAVTSPTESAGAAEGGYTPYVATAPTVTDTITYDDTVSNDTLNTTGAKVQKSEDDTTEVTGTWAWKDSSYGNAGTHDLIAVFTPNDQTYTSVEQTISVTVKPKDLGNGVSIGYIVVPTYTGQALEPDYSLLITAETKRTLGSYNLVKGKDCTVTYENNVNAGKSTATATVKPKEGSNYTFNEASRPFSIDKATADETLQNSLKNAVTVLDGTYNGSPQKTLTVGTLPDGWTATYKSTYSEYGNFIPTLTDARNKYVYVKFENSNYKDVEATYVAKLARKDISDATVTLDSTTLTYNGSEQTKNVTSVEVDGRTLTVDKDYTVSGNKETNAGTYTITIAGTGNYTGTVTKTWTIKQKALAVDDFNIPNLSELTYNGIPQSVAAPTTKSTIEGMGNVTVWYAGKGTTTYEKSTIAPTNAGTYTVTFSVAEGQNYSAVTDLSYGTLTINKLAATDAVLVATVNADQTAVYGIGDFVQPTFKLGDKTIDGTLAYSGTIASEFNDKTYAEVKAMLATGTKNQKYTLTYKFTPSDKTNFTDAVRTGSIDVTVKDIEFAGADSAITEKTNPVYGDKWSDILSLDSTKISASVNGTSVSGIYKLVNADGGEIDLNAVPAPGTIEYNIAFTGGDYKNTKVFATNKSITITAKTLTVKPKDQQITVGDTLPTFSLECIGLASGDEAAAVITNFASKVGTVAASVDGKSTGTFEITAPDDLSLAVGYSDKYTLTTEKGTLTVKAAYSGGGGGGAAATVQKPDIDGTTNTADKQISEVKEKVAALSLKARSSRTAKKNIKVVASLNADAKAAIEDIQNLGYTVKYKFYRSTKKASGYKAMLTKTTKTYINTIGKAGTRYYYKAQICVYDKDGKLVAKTALKQCKYATRVFR